MIFRLLQTEIDCLKRQKPHTRGDGGFQGLLVKLGNRVTSSGLIWLSAKDLERIQRYAFKYGNGGWENRLKQIFSRTLGPNLNGIPVVSKQAA